MSHTAAAVPSATPPSATSPTESQRSPGSRQNPLLQLLRRIHFYAGIFIGPFLLVAALSGVAYALAPTAETILHRGELTAASSAQTVSIDDQVAKAKTKHPGLALSGVIPGTDGATTKVLFTDPSQPSTSYRPAVFVDPSTGEVKGDTVLYGSSLAFPERAWLSELHRNLHLGEPGRIYSELAASWLGPITLAGLFLWWKRRASGASRATSPWAQRARKHSTIGVIAGLGFLFLSATGLTWSAYAGDNVTNLRTALSWTTPTVAASLQTGEGTNPEDPHAGHGAPSGTSGSAAAASGAATTYAAVVTVADGAGLKAPYEITPATEKKGWVVKEVRRSWMAGPDAVAISPATGKVMSSVPFSSYPLAAKLTDWGIRLHMGFLFGLLNQVILALIAAALAVVVIMGYRMWWMRRPTRGASFLGGGTAPVRGGLMRLLRARPVLTVLGALAVAAWAVFVPLLGISLVAFLVIDALLGLRGRKA